MYRKQQVKQVTFWAADPFSLQLLCFVHLSLTVMSAITQAHLQAFLHTPKSTFMSFLPISLEKGSLQHRFLVSH